MTPSIDTLKDNLLRAIDAEYNVIKPDIILDIISQLEQTNITKDQLQTTRLGREINQIRQKIDARKKRPEECPELLIEIAHRAKKLLRSWQELFKIDSNTKPRLILKVKLNPPVSKRKRKKSAILDGVLPRLKSTQELLFDMQRNEQSSTIHAIFPNETVSPTRTSSSDLSSFQTVADLVDDHRRRILTEYDSREIQAKPDLLLVPLDQLAYVYEREKLHQMDHSSITSVEQLPLSSPLFALPFIDCPIEYNFILDELVVEHPIIVT